MKHLCSLLGRIFIIASPGAIINWRGDSSSILNEETDYESLDKFISYDEGDLTMVKKSIDCIYYLYFSMSSKIELFSVENGFVICDGLYFNESWDYTIELSFKFIAKIDIEINITEEMVHVYDAVLEGESLLLPETVFHEGKDRMSIKLANGSYSVNKVETTILIDGEEVLLKGIMISR